VVDDLTARFKYRRGPYPLFVAAPHAQVMESEKVIKEKGHEWMQDNPVGTGPYKLGAVQKKQSTCSCAQDYWDQAATKYVRVRIIPEQATQIAELISGGVDIIKRAARSDGRHQQVGVPGPPPRRSCGPR